MRFELGQVVATAAVDSRMTDDPKFSQFVRKSLTRYMFGDWGNTSKEDSKANDSALKNNDDRILASYRHESLPTIWIITEWDHSVTTILFPEDY